MTDFFLSPKYRVSDWQGLDLDHQIEEPWQKAIDLVADRIQGRIVETVDVLVDKSFAGFMIVALDCLLIETLVGFKAGHRSSGGAEDYVEFMTNSNHFKHEFDEGLAKSFCKNVRNGIIHDTQTRDSWLIEKTVPAGRIIEVSGPSKILNRTNFHTALKKELSDWLLVMKNGDQYSRRKMRCRMDEIIRTS